MYAVRKLPRNCHFHFPPFHQKCNTQEKLIFFFISIYIFLLLLVFFVLFLIKLRWSKKKNFYFFFSIVFLIFILLLLLFSLFQLVKTNLAIVQGGPIVDFVLVDLKASWKLFVQRAVSTAAEAAEIAVRCFLLYLLFYLTNGFLAENWNKYYTTFNHITRAMGT